MKASKRSFRRQEGAAAVEFAIVASLLFLLIFGIIDFGFAFHAWNNTANAAREGARRAAVDPSTADIIARTQQAARTLDATKLTISVQCSTNDGVSFGGCGPSNSWQEGDVIRVNVDYVYDLITPLGSFVPGLGPTMNVHSMSEARFEGQ
jgi:Flp pilus assembly protein TadG